MEFLTTMQGALLLVPLIVGQLSATMWLELLHPPPAVFACELHAFALPSLRMIITFCDPFFPTLPSRAPIAQRKSPARNTCPARLAP